MVFNNGHLMDTIFYIAIAALHCTAPWTSHSFNLEPPHKASPYPSAGARAQPGSPAGAPQAPRLPALASADARSGPPVRAACQSVTLSPFQAGLSS